MSQPLVVDLGFSTAKVMHADKKFRVPSAFRPQAGGCAYGEDALIKTSSSYLKTPEELIRHYPAFVRLCADRAEVAKVKDVRLAVGLPYRFWASESRDGGAVGHLRDNLKKECGFADVMVLPQGLGGIKSFVQEFEGNLSGNVLAIDIGFNTVIFTLFDPDRGQIVYGNTYNKRGIHQMAVEYVMPRIEHLAPSKSFSPLEISILIERGEVEHGFDKHDIRSEVSQAAEEYMEPILADIYGEVQAELGTHANPQHVILFGGGGALLRDRLPENAPFTVLREPEYANARGFALLAAD